MFQTRIKVCCTLLFGIFVVLLAMPAFGQTAVAGAGEKCGTSAECTGDLVCIKHHCAKPPSDASSASPPAVPPPVAPTPAAPLPTAAPPPSTPPPVSPPPAPSQPPPAAPLPPPPAPTSAPPAAATGTPAPSSPAASAEKPGDGSAPPASKPHTQGVGGEIAACVGYGTNNLNPGIGIRGGILPFAGLYAGASFIYYIGSSGAGFNLVHVLTYGIDAGYGFPLGDTFTIRPQLGLGNASVSSPDGGASNSHVYLEPLVVGLARFGYALVGADLGVLYLPGASSGTALVFHLQGGVRF